MVMKNVKKKIQRIPYLFLLMLFSCLTASAQQGITVKGTVVDDNGETIIGASVVVKGNNSIGTISDIDGNFVLTVPNEKSVLVVSFVGMEAQEVKATKGIIRVILKDDTQLLDEVVVVGYGQQKKASVVGAITQTSGKTLERAGVNNLGAALTGNLPGVITSSSTGMPGAEDPKIIIRTQSSWNNSEPLVLVDGIEREMSSVDISSVENISVLKDASAVAVYGLDANGAFIVTTKKGQTDKVTISYTGTVGISQNAEEQEWLDGPGYAYWYNKARLLQGDTEVFTVDMVRKMREGVDGWGNTNWYDKVYGTGVRQHHNISASGGSEKIRFFTSIGYLEEKGNIDKFKYRRMNLRSNIDAQLAKGLSLSLGVSGRIEKRDAPKFSADPDDWMNIPQQVCYALPYVQDTYEYNGKIYDVSTPTSGSPVAPIASIYAV